MHWLRDAAVRSGFKGATTLLIPDGTSATEAWNLTARELSVPVAELTQKVAATFGLRAANLLGADASAARLVPERVARRYNVLPLHDSDRRIVVATSDPHNIECEQAVAFASGRRVAFELAPPQPLAEAINGAYAADHAADAVFRNLDEALNDAVQVIHDSRPEALEPIDVEAGPVVRLTNLVLRDAVLQRASDIHVEPGDGNGAVRFRVDGVMRQYMGMPMAALNRVVSRIKVLSRLDIADRVRPQDGRARLEIEGRVLDLRVSTVPMRDAEKVVIRLLRPDATSTLDDIALHPVELGRLRRLLSHRDGILLVTGPTGSGKTTTMYAALRELANTGDFNIMTVEDPVEYQLPGIGQIQADSRRGVTFASALRAILRQDPDVIFVGEIRDLETAQIAVQAAMTGHLVLATLHTNDAMSAVARLLDLGLERSTLASTLRGCVAQRLVRTVCGECSGSGCAHCARTGFHGRLPINEVAIITPEVTELIATGATQGTLQAAAIAAGMRPLREVAAALVAGGRTSTAEVERVVGDLAPSAGATDAAPGAVPAAPTILIVEDDPVQRMLVSATLEKGGFRVSMACDGLEALRRIEGGQECALVLTDLNMPELDGDELLRRLRADPRTVALPVVVLTGSSQTDREPQLIEAGADDYIRKPIDPPRLIARVRAALRRAA